MVSINPKITPRVNLKLPNSGNGNEGNTQETGKNADENAKAVYVPGKSIGDIKPDVLLAYNGVTIGRPGQVVEPPKAETMGEQFFYESFYELKQNIKKTLYNEGDAVFFRGDDGNIYGGIVGLIGDNHPYIKLTKPNGGSLIVYLD